MHDTVRHARHACAARLARDRVSGGDGFAVHGFLGVASAARASRLGEDGGEGARHVLGNQHRHPMDDFASCATSFDSACGPPVDEPISSARGEWRRTAASAQRARIHLRRHKCEGGGTGSVAAWNSAGATMAGVEWRADAPAAAEMTNFFDQFAAERWNWLLRVSLPALGYSRRRRALRLEADLRVAARQRRRHDDDDVTLLLQQQRQRRNAVEFRHVDIEQHDVRTARSIWSTASRPVRSAAVISMSGSASTQRASKPRTTTASSTTMTRIGLCACRPQASQQRQHYSWAQTFLVR